MYPEKKAGLASN